MWFSPPLKRGGDCGGFTPPLFYSNQDMSLVPLKNLGEIEMILVLS
jgi:hypothetical protein